MTTEELLKLPIGARLKLSGTVQFGYEGSDGVRKPFVENTAFEGFFIGTSTRFEGQSKSHQEWDEMSLGRSFTYTEFKATKRHVVAQIKRQANGKIFECLPEQIIGEV